MRSCFSSQLCWHYWSFPNVLLLIYENHGFVFHVCDVCESYRKFEIQFNYAKYDLHRNYSKTVITNKWLSSKKYLSSSFKFRCYFSNKNKNLFYNFENYNTQNLFFKITISIINRIFDLNFHDILHEQTKMFFENIKTIDPFPQSSYSFTHCIKNNRW